MSYAKTLEAGRKTYYLKCDTIISIESDGFGSTITHKYLESDNLAVLEKVWGQFHDIYACGKQDKLNQLKRALEIR